MKKRWLAMIAVGVIGIGVLVIGGRTEPVKVTTTVLKAERVEQTVVCNGMVESAKATGVFLPLSCVIEQVCVKDGARVQKGDVLAVIDKQATYESTDNEAVRMRLAAMAEEITAPESGIVVGVNVTEGMPADSGTPCVLLALERDLQVRLCLREKDLQVIQKGMTVRLTGEGFSRPMYYGTLTEISAAARTDTGSGIMVEGVVELDEGQRDESLRLGLNTRATVVTAVKESGVLVPHEAVLSDENGTYVYLLKDGRAVRKDLNVAGQVAAGVLLADETLVGQTIICTPEKIHQNGMAVEGETP